MAGIKEKNGFDKWKTNALVNQCNFANSLADRIWDKYTMPAEDVFLWKAIAFAFAGPPQSEDESIEWGYTKEQKEKITELKQKCIEYCKQQKWKDVFVAFIFVCAYNSSNEDEAIVPLIRVKKSNGEQTINSYFIDHFGRCYENWDNFCNENCFVGWWICVPKQAQYSFSENGEVQVEFIDETHRGKTLRNLDNIAMVTNIGTTVSMASGLLMSLFPPTLPFGIATMAYSAIAGTPGALYGTTRSVGTLIDRYNHKQSINPFNSGEARSCWLTTAASALSYGMMASTTILTTTAKAGYLVSSGTRAFCTALNVTCLSVNGLGIINSFYEISKKDKVAGLDILQLTTSIFFFTHSAISFKTASSIIKEAQAQAIQVHKENLSNIEQKVFDQMQKAKQEMVEPGKVRIMEGNKEFIRELKKIENKQEFFKNFKLVDGYQLNVNNELVIDPKAFLQMTKSERESILQHSNDLKNGKITEAKFNEYVSGIRKEYRITFERQTIAAINKMKKAFKVSDMADVQVNGKKIFKNMQQHEVSRLNQVLSEAGKNYDERHIEVSLKMANEIGCKNVAEFTAATEYAIRQLNKEVANMRQTNPNPVREAGIKAKDFYFDQKATEFLENPQVVVESFTQIRKKCDAQNTGNPRFSNSFSAANHYDKHPYFPKIDSQNNLSPKRYFQIATEMCSGTMKDPKWTQDGSSIFCKFIHEKYGAVAVRFDNISSGTSVIATLMAADLVTPLGEPQLHSAEEL